MMANYAEPRVVDSAQGVRDRRVGPVVRDDELELRNRLRQDALDALAHRGVRVVRSHHDGGQRRSTPVHLGDGLRCVRANVPPPGAVTG